MPGEGPLQQQPKPKESRRERARRLRQNMMGGLRLAWAASPRNIVIILSMSTVTAMMPPAAVWLGRDLARLIRIGVAAHQPFTIAIPTVIGLGLLAAGQRVIGILQATRQELFNRRVILETERRFYRQSAIVDLGHFDNSDWHDRVARAKRDMNWRPGQLNQAIIGLLGSAVTLSGMLGLLFLLHPLLVVLSLLSVLPSLTIQRRVNRRIYEFFFTNTPEERERDYIGELVSMPRTSKEIRAFMLSDHLLSRRSELAEGLYEKMAKLYLAANRAYSWSGLLSGAALALAYAFVAFRGFQGGLKPEDLIVVIGAFASVTGQVGLISGSLLNIDQHATFLDDYFSFLKIEPLVKLPEGPLDITSTPTSAEIREHGIVFQDIHFQYPGGTEEALSGTSLKINGGELLALVGENGAGKTSLVKLLLRFYDPQRGTIKVGGHDLRDMDPVDLRSKIGILFQDFAMYELSVRENVTLGRVERDGDDDEVLVALEAARADWLAKKLGNGLDAKVGRLFEGGHDLSGGEWQRLALARLMYRDADIWILDEPTAALDPEAEAGIFAELRANLKGRMGIVISHRFSTVRIADRIAVIGDGRVQELGTHEELLALSGRYAQLFEMQAAGYR